MSEELEINEPKFETIFTKQTKKQGLDIGNPKITKYGQELDVREWIHENNVDCEIYETLEKYGTIKQRSIDMPQLLGEIENLDLRKHLDREIATGKLWENLPLDVRKEFNHDKNNFAENGETWLKDKIEEAKITTEPPQGPMTEPTPEAGE